MKGLLCFLAVALVAIALVSLPSAAAATELPARVETSAINPPAPQFNAHAAGVPSFPVATTSIAAALPGEPVRNAGRAVRGAGRGVLRFIFRGRGRGC